MFIPTNRKIAFEGELYDPLIIHQCLMGAHVTMKSDNYETKPFSYEKFLSWQSGKGCIQDVFPKLSSDDREFLMTGITPDEWDELFGEE